MSLTPPDRIRQGPLGDLPITDPQAMRALAHPVRLAALSFLQRNGPATATMLAPEVGATPSVTSWHLRHLASFGLVTDADPDDVPGDRRQRWWKAAARGFRIEPGDGPEYQAAWEVLGRQLLQVAREQVDTWLHVTAPRLSPEWRQAASVSNTGVWLTPDELRALDAEIDQLLGPYVMRPEADRPAGAGPVRVLRHFLPETTVPETTVPGTTVPYKAGPEVTS
jgi:DNA-binding transcriptional ArsR family regulator